MEPIQQIEEWQRQVEAARPGAAADMDVVKRLLKHGAEALADIKRLKDELAFVHQSHAWVMRERDRLQEAIRATLDESAHLADGEVCTLIQLKRALPAVDSKPTDATLNPYGVSERCPVEPIIRRHTSGPWHVIACDGMDFTAIATTLPTGDEICEGDEVLGASEWLRVKPADLQLMAAAPELLDALIDLRKWFCEQTGRQSTVVDAAIEKALSA